MASSSIPILFFFAASLLIGVVLASDTKATKVHGRDDQERLPFTYSEADEWGTKYPKYKVCSSGKRQSPVDINTYEIVLNKTLQPLARNYHVDKAKLLTTGRVIEISFQGGGEGDLEIDGKKYTLNHLHFHTPSEHLLNGVQYAAELHQVHTADDGSRAVVGILFKHGERSQFVETLMPQLEQLAKKPCSGDEQSVVIPKFKESFLRKWPRNYYRYQGSLTSPPCDENVIWSVLTEAKTMSKKQVDALKAPLCEENKKNARTTQPLNGRKVQKYDRN